MPAFLTGLLANLAIVAAVVAVWTNFRDRLPKLNLRFQSCVFGVVMGTGAVISMMLPFEVRPGLIVDLRTALLAIAGFFEGPLAAIIAGGLAIIARPGIGGIGTGAGS